ncbi:MAG: serine/threonine protein kinase [Myxococcales bacterium]|nr:serine/threonine protein kinase [Myxococcales bacterium]
MSVSASFPLISSASELARCGPYELLVRIGRGGMASVYLARRTDAADGEGPDGPQLFALKILHPELAEQAEYVDMLMDEAKIATRLAHTHVVDTIEIGRDGDLYYLVMEYVEGVALDRLLRRSPEHRPAELIVPLAIDALLGLHAAHRLKDPLGRPLELVHRDVTPGNLLVGVDGLGRITDFGVAKARARITKTNPGVVKGKAGYIAPEVILGRDVDGRADVFSMGVLLYNALTGMTLFDRGDLASSLTSLLREDIPPPSSVGLMPSPLFDAPILTALARDPAHRHESAAEMADALADALLLLPEPGDRAAIAAWVRESYGETLDQRRAYAKRGRQDPWNADDAEPLSTSAMVRKDPTGRVVSAIPDETPEARVVVEPAPPPSKLKLALWISLAFFALVAAGAIGAIVATALGTG